MENFQYDTVVEVWILNKLFIYLFIYLFILCVFVWILWFSELTLCRNWFRIFRYSRLGVRWACILATLLVVMLAIDLSGARLGMEGGRYTIGFGPMARRSSNSGLGHDSEELIRRGLRRRLAGSAVVPDQVAYFFTNKTFVLCRSLCFRWEYCDSYWWDGIGGYCFLDASLV